MSRRSYKPAKQWLAAASAGFGRDLVWQHSETPMRGFWRFGTILTVSILFSDQAFAHARWFIDESAIGSSPKFVPDGYYMMVVLGAAAFILASWWIEHGGRGIPSVERIAHRPWPRAAGLDWQLLSIVFGGSLIANSALHVFIAPNLPAGRLYVCDVLMLAQMLVGMMFLLRSHLLAASLATMLLPFICMCAFSFGHMMDYMLELCGIGAALFLVAPSLSQADRNIYRKLQRMLPIAVGLQLQMRHRMWQWDWSRRCPPSGKAACQWRERLAAHTLRVGLGLQLVVLAAHDKLLDPAVSLAFVNKYSFVNFPALLGLHGFSNLHFVFAAGVAEVTLGTLLVLQIATRLACFSLLGLFTLTGFVFGGTELIGHLPIMAVLAVLLVRGGEFGIARPSAALSPGWSWRAPLRAIRLDGYVSHSGRLPPPAAIDSAAPRGPMPGPSR